MTQQLGPTSENSDQVLNSKRRGQSLRKKGLFGVAAICFGLFLGFFIAEISIRLLGLAPPKLMTKRQLIPLNSDAVVYYHCYPDNPNEEFKPVPDVTTGRWKLQNYTFEQEPVELSRLKETPWCVEYLHSSKGIRDSEFLEEPPADRIRLGIVGDSFVFGEGVPVEKTLSRQMQKLLGDKYECMNAGQVGANAEQEFAVLDAIVREANCERVVLVLIPNDIPLTLELAAEQAYINDFILIRDQYLERAWDENLLLGHSRVLDLIAAPRAMAKIRNETIEWYLNCYSNARNGQNLKWMQEQLNSLAARKDCQTVVVLYPLLENLERGYPLKKVHQVLGNMVSQAGLPLLDLTPTFLGRQTKDLWVHETDHHPNGKAQHFAAESIVQWLNEENPWRPMTEQETNSIE